MFSKIKDFLFGSAPVQSPVASPYKVEAIPAGTEASIIASPPTAPAVEAVVVVPDAVVPSGVVDTADIAIAQLPDPVAVPAKKKPAAKKAPAAKKPAVKTPRAPKAPKV
jgi:hypothetical protein